MNAAAIAAALGERAESVCRRYLPHGRKHGRYWVAGDLDGARGRSLYVRLPTPATATCSYAPRPGPPPYSTPARRVGTAVRN